MRSVVWVLSVFVLSFPWHRANADEMAGNIDLAKAARYFAEFDSLCGHEARALWGVSFCGPILLVDPSTRQMVANRPDTQQLLAARAGVYVGEVPAGLPVANTAVEWQGARWTMIMWWSLSANQRPRSRLMAHESFHRIQPQLGLEAPGELNDHLDTADGRFWMQLEWNALQKALLAETDAARREAITDALAFRAARRALFPKAAAREIALEIHEGLAEYSGMHLAGYTPELVVKAVQAKRQDETGFVRSFAYVSGPLYGFLLDGASTGWRRQCTPATDLGALLATAAHLDAVTADQAAPRAAAYGGDELRGVETARETQRQAQLAAWRTALVDGPVLIVDLTKVKSGSFDPGKVFPMAEKQTVYTTRELEAEWGILSIDAGAILEDSNTNEGRVSLAGAAADHTSGPGWTVKLAGGWRVEPAARAGDFRIVKP